MTVPTGIANGATYGGDFRMGTRSSAPAIVIVGDSRGAGLHCTTTYDDYMTGLHQFKGVSFVKVNRAWQSLTALTALDNPYDATGAGEQVLSALSFYAPVNIVVVGPIGVNDLQLGASYSTIQTRNENLCKLYRALGCKVVFISEVSSITTQGGLTGDGLKNNMRAWAIAGGAGNEYWRNFADAYVDVGGFPPFGQDASGTYGTSGLGHKNSTAYYTDEVHWTNSGNSTLAANVQPVLNTLIDTLDAANYVKPALPTFSNLLARVKVLEGA